MSGRFWTEAEIEYLRGHYADTPLKEILEHCPHGAGGIQAKAKALGLRKSMEFRREAGRRTSQLPQSQAHRFKKGSVPANKGKRQEDYLDAKTLARCREKRWSKENHPDSSKPVGYERFWLGDQTWYVKVAEGQPMVKKHRWLWEQANGKVPEGHVLVFRDGNRRNCVLSNLECVTRSEAARRISARMTDEERRARLIKIHEHRRETIRRDRIRLHFGLPAKTKIVTRWAPRPKKAPHTGTGTV